MRFALIALAATSLCACSSNNSSTCAGLDQAHCAARSDCVADTCAPQCTCDTEARFLGCRAPGEEPMSCAHLECVTPAGCDDSDGGSCPDGTACIGFTELQNSETACCSCDNPCTTASDCGSDFLCEPNACGCGNVCQLSCAFSGCAHGQTCGADGHCHGPQCHSAGDCLAFEECDAGACVRLGCDDALCDGGSCVRGLCWLAKGQCLAARPGP